MYYLSPAQYDLLKILKQQGAQRRPRSVAPNTVRSCIRRNWVTKDGNDVLEITEGGHLAIDIYLDQMQPTLDTADAYLRRKRQTN